MKQENVILPRKLVMQLLTHAQFHPETPVGGVIGMQGEDPVRAWAVAGPEESTTRKRFEFDGASLDRALHDMDIAGEKIFAVYFSSPEPNVRPAAADLKRSGFSSTLHLLVSLGTRGVLELAGWVLVDDEVLPVEIGIRESG
ncbi:MAG: hypothetical protein R3217_10220 [Gammaproteobacteria bacterium]|nr:hypothetical protein [Gammaproteobacteria bacterium]